jgi:hypothetical protein
MKRAAQMPEELSPAYVFLALAGVSAGYITGIVLPVTGSDRVRSSAERGAAARRGIPFCPESVCSVVQTRRALEQFVMINLVRSCWLCSAGILGLESPSLLVRNRRAGGKGAERRRRHRRRHPQGAGRGADLRGLGSVFKPGQLQT